MMSSVEELQAVFSYLRSLNFHFSDNWVTDCVNYYKYVNACISLEKLKNEVKQQWLLVNLREFKVPSLPPGASHAEKTVLYGKYAVQVESVVDCSESYYSQFRKLKKFCDENIEATKETKDWKIKSSRCLVLTVSDGVQQLQAMEYEPINKIRTNDPELLPGFKMILVGPVECRKGMILLKEENVIIYGGEVDTLTSSNSLKSLLIKKLDLNESDYSEEIDNLNEANFKCKVEELSITKLLSENDDLLLSLPLETEILEKSTVKNECKTWEVIKKEKSEISGGISYLNDNEFVTLGQGDISKPFNKKHGLLLEDTDAPSQKRISLDPDIEIIGPSTYENHYFNNDESQVQILLETCNVKKSIQTKLSSFFHSTGSEKNKSDMATAYIHPFIYLKQIVEFTLKKPCTFTVKSIILTLNKKITVVNNEYHLSAIITDGSLCLDVDFSSSVVESTLGFSPCEMMVMIKSKEGNSAVESRVKEAFAKAQQQLISINCLMIIKCFPDNKKPVILSFDELNIDHLSALKQRQKCES